MEAPKQNNASLIDLGYVYDHVEDVEVLERYRLGGFHPVSLGETLQDGRLRIVHKLGHRAYSTVWLAWDSSRQTYVAVKICSASSNNDLNEYKILKLLSTSSSLEHDEHLGKKLFRLLLDDFEIVGPNGKHSCFVTAPAMMSLKDAMEASVNGFFQLSVARALVAQIVQATHYLHDKGVVHGDLHLGNVLLQLPDHIKYPSPDELYKQFGDPETVPITRLDGAPLGEEVPAQAILPIWFGKESEQVNINEAKVFLVDFGGSYLPSTETRRCSNSPLSCRPPEGHFPDFSEPFSFIDLLGKLPPQWWQHWEDRSKYWVKDGDSIKLAPTRAADHKRWDWESRLELCVQKGRREKSMQLFSDDEEEDFIAMMKLMTVFEPERRATAKDILKSRWMRRWALPDLDKVHKS
ncbi:Fc.00g005440.m01.CDS01 [Cosmosporella sp. VM-42]